MVNNQNNIVNGGAVNGVSQITGQLDMSPPYLTPEALMSYCASRLRGLDEQVQSAFEKQKVGNEESKILSELNESLGAEQPGTWDVTSTDNAMKVAAGKFNAAADKVPEPLKSQLQHQAQACLAKMGNTMTPDQYRLVASDPVSAMQKDINSGTELSMINLQSLMSQRQSSVQMVTNMVQSLGDQMNKIAANIGH